MKTRQCKGCGADILWVLTESGKRAPLDYPPEKRYIITGTADGHYTGRMVDTYVSHFATCPAAKQFRKEDR